MAEHSGAADAFANLELFEALRLAPYFRSVADVHPHLGSAMAALCESFASPRSTAVHTVVHGDVSPKNVLLGPQGPVLLDAECACWGDGAFDLAFLLTHLLLKARHRPDAAPALHRSADAAWTSYTQAAPGLDDPTFESRVVRWWAALVLARIDGRSPVEYLAEDVRRAVRSDVLVAIASEPTARTDLEALWRLPS